MARYVTTLRTPRPAAEAFAYLADFSNAQHWDPGVASATRTGEGDAALGEHFDLKIAFGGTTMPMRYTIIELDAPNRVVLRSETDRLGSLDTITVQEDADGTTVTYDAELRLKGLWGVGEPFLRLVFGRIGDKAAAGLRKALDGTKVGA